MPVPGLVPIVPLLLVLVLLLLSASAEARVCTSIHPAPHRQQLTKDLEMELTQVQDGKDQHLQAQLVVRCGAASSSCSIFTTGARHLGLGVTRQQQRIFEARVRLCWGLFAARCIPARLGRSVWC